MRTKLGEFGENAISCTWDDPSP